MNVICTARALIYVL